MQEELMQLIPYAPLIVVIIVFCTSHKVFITPSMLNEILDKRLKDYVLKESHDLVINEIKEDISEIKKSISTITAQNNEMYNKIMNLM